VLVVVLVGAALLLRRDDAKVPTRLVQQPCPQQSAAAPPARPVALPQPRQVRLALLNGTSRNGLAKSVGDELAARGFVVTAQGNAPAALAGPSRVVFGPGAAPAATVVSRWVLGSVTVGGPRVARGTVEVTLGSAFQRLATPAEVASFSPAGTEVGATSSPSAQPSGCAR